MNNEDDPVEDLGVSAANHIDLHDFDYGPALIILDTAINKSRNETYSVKVSAETEGTG